MNNKFKLFAVGPVEMHNEILELGSEQLPYFRTQEFSNIMFRNSALIKKFVETKDDSNVVFLTASGTGAMEATVINTFSSTDKLLVVSGGSFGQRFVDICKIYKIDHTVIKLKQGESLKKEVLEQYKNQGYTGFLLNVHETSTGVCYDLPMIGEFCKSQDITLVVDAISSFLADPLYMDEWNVDVMIISSQKALALPPGISIVVLNEKTTKKVLNNNVQALYFNFKNYLADIKRGQTPYTPAVGILMQLEQRLEMIDKVGIENIIKHTSDLAKDFRHKIKDMPFDIPSEKLSNAVTPLKPLNDISANEIFLHLKNKYNIFVCPNGGELKDSLFRVGHIGNLTIEDNDELINALKEMQKEGII